MPDASQRVSCSSGVPHIGASGSTLRGSKRTLGATVHPPCRWRATQNSGAPTTASSGTVRAIASDSGAGVEGRPTFDLDDTGAIAEFILGEVGLS